MSLEEKTEREQEGKFGFCSDVIWCHSPLKEYVTKNRIKSPFRKYCPKCERVYSMSGIYLGFLREYCLRVNKKGKIDLMK